MGKTVNFKPLGNRVLAKPVSAEDKTTGGIIIPDTAKEKPQKAEVVAVGNGTEGHEMTVKPGDVIVYGKFAGTEIELNEEQYLILNEDDIYGIV
ncbi:MAG: co-chaperone GroES [Bacteroidales bacterium]|nr:co-chaperone GroES [Bacteroidales bacterium]MCF8327490.1 co-chaperone GroES [Bacteroidales bacterium]